MPSIHVKKERGYQHIDDAPLTGRPRSRSVVSRLTLSQPDQGYPLHRPPTWSGSDAPTSAPRPALGSRTPSKVFDHIMSTTRRPHRGSVSQRTEPGTPAAGSSQLRDSGAPPQSSVRRIGDTYVVEGQQADLRVPVEDGQGLEGSQVNLALEQMSENEYDHDDSTSQHHHDDIVEHLDVIDPQISTVSTLTNAMNAIVIPPLSFYSRKPVVVLPRLKRKRRKVPDPEKGEAPQEDEPPQHEDALDRHVEDVLSKRDQFRRVMQGVWSFCKTPLGFITAIYGFLVVFWGSGIVLFLAKMINLHNPITQGFWVELCQQVETGLFSATSIGFIPFRVMDTYRICKIWHYKRKIAKLREKAGLPELYDPDDLPDPVYDPNYVQVLTEKQQIDLHYQQHQFMKSQTWYRPHGTQTHRAFPINLALWICVCNDLNSFFQCLLSGTMWGLDRFARPAWTTGTTLPAAFVAGIIAGVLIYWGGRQTRRTEQVTERLRMALEMDPENKEEPGDESGSGSGAGTGPGSSPRAPLGCVEEVAEGPNGNGELPAAQTARSSTETASSAPVLRRDAEKGSGSGSGSDVAVDAKVEADVDEKQTQTQTQTQTEAQPPQMYLHPPTPPPMERRPSGRSLQFADEMVVPAAEDIHARS